MKNSNVWLVVIGLVVIALFVANWAVGNATEKNAAVMCTALTTPQTVSKAVSYEEPRMFSTHPVEVTCSFYVPTECQGVEEYIACQEYVVRITPQVTETVEEEAGEEIE